MFTHKKILAALLFAPLFVGCVVEDGDDDDGAETGTASATQTATQTATVTDTDGTATVTVTETVTDTDGTATVTATETDATATVTVTDTDTADTGTDTTGDTDTGGGGMFCQATCTEAVDCCPAGTEELGCPDEHPLAYECNAGLCEVQPCADDADCATVAGTVCLAVNDVNSCVATCTEETEAEVCLVDFGETCSGMSDDGQMICQFSFMCTSDKECGDTGLVCDEASGACVCDGDDDCASPGLGGTCDLATGFCGCTDDASCGEGFSCVAP
jgi:hypothetical protein